MKIFVPLFVVVLSLLIFWFYAGREQKELAERTARKVMWPVIVALVITGLALAVSLNLNVKVI